MSTNPISVCIPARNEKNTILSTIDSALNNDYQGELEVLVCVNGCDDGTEQIVQEASERHDNVYLHTSKPGKPNAWNKLVKEASYNDLVFLDGDVIVKKGSFEALQEVYNHDSKLIGVAAGLIKVLDDLNIFEKIINLPTDMRPYGGGFCGRMYSIKREGFFKMLNAKGYSKMPKNIINEDTWTSLILEIRENGKRKEKFWESTNKAKIYFKPSKIGDMAKERYRVTQGHLQISYEHPILQFQVKDTDSVKKWLVHYFSKWKKLDNNYDRIAVPYRFITNSIVNRIFYGDIDKRAKKDYLNGKFTNLWALTTSSKTEFNMDKLQLHKNSF